MPHACEDPLPISVDMWPRILQLILRFTLLFETSYVLPQKPFRCFQRCCKSVDIRRLRHFPAFSETAMLPKSLRSR
ncbi:hypothetical protein TNCV_1572181 [Trichonephila clavipes]|uniref:Uncharacterized protein n=1 Tax=Trichonephila clavipes TaxID=2585209 RepID=A0A8X6SKI4_TRICX|nr:hypothetical protein TNCV_1572181 [Trichonephila clavipes]